MTDQGETPGRILIVDREADVVEPLKLYFGGQGFEVLTTASAEEAPRLAARQRPNIILLAATLGAVDGVEVFRQLRRSALTAHIPIMFITSYRDTMRQNQLLAEGADDVIPKPFDVEILGLRVRNAIQRTQREGLTEPRTGLPAGPIIAEKINEWRGRADGCRLDLTIAHFEAFRARYNFISGNDVLRYAANTINEIVGALGGDEAFVGHHREAVFIVLTTRDQAPALQEALQARLNEGLLQFYSFIEREQGYILLEDSRGGMQQRPLMHLDIRTENFA